MRALRDLAIVATAEFVVFASIFLAAAVIVAANMEYAQ